MDSSNSTNSSAQIAFVFNNVANYEILVGAFRPEVEVHVLDAGSDGLAQMAAILAGRSGVAALHVVGHGNVGTLDFGSVTLDAASIGAYDEVLGRIGAALAADGDILLYGCDVAGGALGAKFVGQIAQATGADVAASSDATGGDDRGGNWVLEYRQGEVTADGAFDAQAVRSLDTLLVVPAAGLNDVTSTMDAGSGHFVTGMTITTASTSFEHDDPLGVYFTGNTAGQALDVRTASLTVGADDSSFDLTGLAWAKYSADGAYTFTVTGYKLGGTTVQTTFSTANGSLAYTAADYSGFTGITGFKIDIATDSAAILRYQVSQNTFDSFSIANPHSLNTAPSFVGATTTITATENVALDVAALLHASDSDSGQTLTWTQQTAPGHGTLGFSGATASSGGANIAPGGTITYTPAMPEPTASPSRSATARPPRRVRSA
jgi:hypothetical protein